MGLLTLGDYSLRRIEEEDLEILLEWRNSDRVREMMLQQHIITWEEHKNWFERIKMYEPARNLIFEYKGKMVGYMGYNGFDEIKRQCVPGSYMAVYKGLPLETGLALFVLCNRYAFDMFDIDRLVSPILAKNTPSIRMNIKLGFEKMEKTEMPEVTADTVEPVELLYITREKWEENHIEIERKISIIHK